MPRTVSIGCQDFETIRENGYFYIDKTSFIREWWEGGDSVTLITRPRRFGKTLALSMVENSSPGHVPAAHPGMVWRMQRRTKCFSESHALRRSGSQSI